MCVVVGEEGFFVVGASVCPFFRVFAVLLDE